jgi:hypothetical protein
LLLADQEFNDAISVNRNTTTITTHRPAELITLHSLCQNETASKGSSLTLFALCLISRRQNSLSACIDEIFAGLDRASSYRGKYEWEFL